MLPNPDNWKYRIYARTLNAWMKVYFRVDIQGLEHLPSKGPGIIVANHQSYLDIPTIGNALHKKELVYRTYWVIGKSTVQNLYLRSLFSVAPVIVVNGTVKKAEWALGQGFFIVIFPEGFYTWHKYKMAKAGEKTVPKKIIGNSAGILGMKTGFPIIPIGVRGTEEVWPPYAFLPKPGRVSLNIGKPFRFDVPEPEAVTDEMIQQKAQIVMQHIDALR